MAGPKPDSDVAAKWLTNLGHVLAALLRAWWVGFVFVAAAKLLGLPWKPALIIAASWALIIVLAPIVYGVLAALESRHRATRVSPQPPPTEP